MLNYLLVLGLIPGTNLQITFYEYLVLLPVGAAIFYIYRHPALRLDILRYYLFTKLYLTTRRGSQISLPL